MREKIPCVVEMNKISWLFLIFGVLIGNIDSYKILGFFPAPARPHYIFGRALLTKLASDGHQVLMVSPFKTNETIPNYSEIVLENFGEFKDGT